MCTMKDVLRNVLEEHKFNLKLLKKNLKLQKKSNDSIQMNITRKMIAKEELQIKNIKKEIRRA